MTYLLYNPLANNSKGEQDARQWAEDNKVECEFTSLLDIKDMKGFFDGLNEGDEVILTGGDGTMNRFANDVYGYEFKNAVYYVKCGSGNDFYRDNEKYAVNGRIDLRPFLRDLPLVTVKGIQRRFVNGIGYGIDGETCRIGDIQRATSDKPVNYSKIAIRLLLGSYKLKKATVDAEGLKITFCSQNVSVVKEHKLVVANGTVSFDGGLSKTVSGITKVMDTEGNFLIIEGSTDTLADGEYPVEVIEDTTSGILLYWSRSERDYVPFINKEDDYYNFGFPVVAANGRIPPSVGIGAITLNDYTDSITPEYYGPRNYTVTVALEDGDQVKSADYIVKNNTGAFLDDILKRIISDYTDSNGNLRFTGSIFLRAGSYALSESDLDLSDFQFLNLIGEDKGTTKIVGGLKFTGLTSGITTVSNLTLTGNITFNTTSKVLYLNETVFKNFTSTKDENVVCIKNSSMDSVTIKKVVEAASSEPTSDEGATSTEGDENQEPQEPQEPEDTSHQMFNIISGSIIGNVNIDTGHTLLTGDTIGILKLHDVLKDVITSDYIGRKYSI